MLPQQNLQSHVLLVLCASNMLLQAELPVPEPPAEVQRLFPDSKFQVSTCLRPRVVIRIHSHTWLCWNACWSRGPAICTSLTLCFCPCSVLSLRSFVTCVGAGSECMSRICSATFTVVLWLIAVVAAGGGCSVHCHARVPARRVCGPRHTACVCAQVACLGRAAFPGRPHRRCAVVCAPTGIAYAHIYLGMPFMLCTWDSRLGVPFKLQRGLFKGCAAELLTQCSTCASCPASLVSIRIMHLGS